MNMCFTRINRFLQYSRLISATTGLSLTGCSVDRMPMLNPVGDVTVTILELFKISAIVMLVIGVPIICATLWIVWRYRASTKHDDYDPEFDRSEVIDKVTLYIPLLTISVLGALTWIYTHRLDPYRARVSSDGRTPYEIQAVSLDYKWLFIYPEAGVAIVNELVAPVGRAVTIRITSDPMMTSIFIPSLISQIYAMPGMETRANFMAPRPAVLDGANAMYSGPEFFKQRFKARLVPEGDFTSWLQSAGATSSKTEPMLDFARYQKLAERSVDNPMTFFSTAEPGLFSKIIQKYEPNYRLSPLSTAAATQAAANGTAAQHKGH